MTVGAANGTGMVVLALQILDEGSDMEWSDGRQLAEAVLITPLLEASDGKHVGRQDAVDHNACHCFWRSILSLAYYLLN